MSRIDGKQFQQRLQKVESLVSTLESGGDPHLRETATELLRLLMELHGAGIEKMMEIVHDTGAPGGEIIDAFAADGLVASLLLLYGLHPLDMDIRVLGALEKVRPYLRSHGGNVELIGINDGVIRLRLQGSCHGCASSAMTLKLAIESAVSEAAPDARGLEVEGVLPAPPQSLVQLENPVDRRAAHPTIPNGGWEEVSGLSAMAHGAVQTADVSGRVVMICRLGEMFYAYANTCPACTKDMTGAMLAGTLLFCPSCGQRFEITHAGRALNQPGLHLEPFPLLMEAGRTRIALPALQARA